LEVGLFVQADILTRRFLNKIAYELIEAALNLQRCSSLPIYFDIRPTKRHRRSRKSWPSQTRGPDRPVCDNSGAFE
jgi:hypothetical protein